MKWICNLYIEIITGLLRYEPPSQEYSNRQQTIKLIALPVDNRSNAERLYTVHLASSRSASLTIELNPTMRTHSTRTHHPQLTTQHLASTSCSRLSFCSRSLTLSVPTWACMCVCVCGQCKLRCVSCELWAARSGCGASN